MFNGGRVESGENDRDALHRSLDYHGYAEIHMRELQ